MALTKVKDSVFDGSTLSDASVARVVANTTGADIIGTELDVDNSGASTRALIRARNSGGGVHFAADSAGNMEIAQTSAAGVVEGAIFAAVRDGKSGMFFNNTEEARTKSGGFVIDDELEIDGALNHDGSTAGFYGTAPIAQATGVAVTAAGIHAALVNLGLITA